MDSPLPYRTEHLVMTEAPDWGRLVLRGAAEAGLAALGMVPPGPLRAAWAGNVAALRLGPDEWWVMTPPDGLAAVRAALDGALAGVAHGLVEISDRQWAVELAGPLAETVLSAFCPLDWTDVPVGGCTRSVFVKADVMVWRVGVERFHLEFARSFAGYALALLMQEVGAGV